MLPCSAALCLLCAPLCAQSEPSRPVVGAIRWDAWTAGSEWERNLGPAQWRSRLPFYGTETGPDSVEIRADTQAVMDQEIAYASAAGLDYWAYCFHLPTDLTQEPDEYALRLHLASAEGACRYYRKAVQPICDPPCGGDAQCGQRVAGNALREDLLL